MKGPLYETPNECLARFLLPVLGEPENGEVAEALLKRFYTVERVLSTDVHTLAETPGVPRRAAEYIRLAVAVTSRRITDRFTFGKVHTKEEFTEYLSALFFGEASEVLFLFVLDDEGRFLGCERIADGTVNMTSAPGRKFLEAALRYENARQIILAHNHPFGTSAPSSDDFRLTASLEYTFRSVGLRLLQHYVVSATGISTVVSPN